MAEEYVILGELDGYYYTDQQSENAALDEDSMRIEPEKYSIHLYNATIKNAKTIAVFDPQEHENYKSICLVGVNNVNVEASPETAFQTDQKFTFGSLILIEPKTEERWYIDRDIVRVSGDKNSPENRTYVHVKSKIVGKTLKSIDINDENLNSDPPLATNSGCLDKASGCFGRIFKWLKWLLLLLLLLWLIRKCDDTEGRERICNDAEKLRKEEQLRRKELDSLNRKLDFAINKELKNISKVYFFENGYNKTISSQNSTEQLVSFLTKYPKTGLNLCGYMNSNPKEKKGIDQKRVKEVYNDLISKGISKERLHIKWGGDSKLIVNPYRQRDASGYYFNRNMRVEASLFKFKDGE